MNPIIGMVLSFALSATAFAAPVRYEYQGPSFEFFPIDGLSGLTAMSGYVFLSEALGPNEIYDTGFSPAPIAWEFTDGRTTIANGVNSRTSTTDNLLLAHFETDGNGEFWNWNILVIAESPVVDEVARMRITLFTTGTGQERSDYCNRLEPDARCVSTRSALVNVDATNVGNWTATVIPIPAALGLFGSALGVLLLRRKIN